jgi:pilus assembly protein Flp/PilA
MHATASRQTGQGMVEYALILVLVSIVVIVILLTLGQQLQQVFSNVTCALAGTAHMGQGGCATGVPVS